MTITNILSALGNNNSIYPLLVRDCGIENVAKVSMTYKQNVKDSKFVARQATRESFIEEYGTSAVWLGGIPLIEKLADGVIKKTGYDPNVDIKLFTGSKAQNIEKNISRFAESAKEEVKELTKIQNNKAVFKNLQIGKFVASTAIPIALMGFILPKMNYALTRKHLKEEDSKSKPKNKQPAFLSMDEFVKKTKEDNNVSFTGGFNILNTTQLQKMMLLDAGLTVGRVGTARGVLEKGEKLFKMLAMCYLNYVAPKNIDKGLNFLTKKLFGINTGLDPKILNDKTFIDAIKESKIELPKGESEEEILKFLDENSKSLFSKIAQEQRLVSYLENGARDPRKFVEVDKVKELSNSISDFMKDAKESGSIEKFAKKAYCAKGFNIVTNVLLSSFLLAVALPKVQFLLRKLVTGSNLDPGIQAERSKKG